VGDKKNFGFETFEYIRHMLEKADERGIDLEHVEQAIEYSEKVAEYPNDKPYKSYLYLSFFNHKPLHVCFAIVNQKQCKVITAYQPNLTIFEKDFKTKRKK
jgi:uncharacterized protein DUF4258